MPFGQDYEAKPAKKGLKISNKEQSTQPKPVDFEEKVEQFMSDKQARNKAMIDLAQQFVGLVKDRTLSNNKGLVAKDVEQQVVSELTSAALVINQDDSEAEGYGSIALINLLFKTALLQRDKLNSLEFELQNLKKKLSSLERAKLSEKE